MRRIVRALGGLFPVSALFWALSFVPAPSAVAQTPGDGPYWFTTPTPANFVSLQGLGSTIYVRTTTEVRFFSGFMRNWTVIPVVAPTVNLYNDYAIVQDSGTVYGYSTRTGTAQALPLNPGAVVVHGPTSSSWVSVVVDGLDAWGFSPFVGGWTYLALQNPGPTVVAGSYVAVLHDGVDAHAFSSIEGVWDSTPAAGASVAAGGLMGAAWDAGALRCFSARRGVWQSIPVANPSAPTFKDELCYVATPASLVAYSALTGNFALLPFSPTALVGSNRASLAVKDGPTVWCYAPGTDAVVAVSASGAQTMQVNAEYVLVDDGGVVTAVSTLTGAVAPPIVGPFSFFPNEDVCFADAPTGSYAYSAILGGWTPAPPVVATQVHTVRNAVVLAAASGYRAFSARHGTWSTLASATTANLTSAIGATFVAIDGTNVAAFDSRLGRWNALTLSAPYAAGSVWRMTAIVHDGVQLYGFSQLNDVWDAVPFSGPTLQFQANDSIAWARTATDIHVYASNATFSTVSRYAEFTRMQARGTPLRLVQTAAPGSYVECVVSGGPAYLPLGPLGVVVIDPALVVGVVPLGFADAAGRVDVSFPLPPDAFFNGVQLYLQNVVTTPAGGVYVSNAATPIVV